MLIKSPSETLSQSYEGLRRPVGDINFASQFRRLKRRMNREWIRDNRKNRISP